MNEFQSNLDFKINDKANVILGSSKDKTNGDEVIIEDIFPYKGKIRVNCKVIKSNHKFWCYYSDLLPLNN
jgi:hypothetical protein